MDRTSLTRIERMNYILGGVIVAVTAAIGTSAQVLGALVGVLLCAINFSAVRRLSTGGLIARASMPKA